MTFTEKLKRLAAEINQSKAAKSVGLAPSTIGAYIAKGSIPRGDIAVKLARALNGPVDWLCDDARDWPPPTTMAAPLSNEELLVELARRLARFL